MARVLPSEPPPPRPVSRHRIGCFLAPWSISSSQRGNVSAVRTAEIQKSRNRTEPLAGTGFEFCQAARNQIRTNGKNPEHVRSSGDDRLRAEYSPSSCDSEGYPYGASMGKKDDINVFWFFVGFGIWGVVWVLSGSFLVGGLAAGLAMVAFFKARLIR